jgi:hypothetical protein
MYRYLTGILAVIIATGAVAFTKPNATMKQNPKTLSYYFQFTGAHGDEANVTEWQEISLSDYNALSCSGQNEGCKIATSSVSNPTASFPNRDISSVTVNANDVPQQTMDNFQVVNKP